MTMFGNALSNGAFKHVLEENRYSLTGIMIDTFVYQKNRRSGHPAEDGDKEGAN